MAGRASGVGRISETVSSLASTCQTYVRPRRSARGGVHVSSFSGSLWRTSTLRTRVLREHGAAEEREDCGEHEAEPLSATMESGGMDYIEQLRNSHLNSLHLDNFPP